MRTSRCKTCSVLLFKLSPQGMLVIVRSAGAVGDLDAANQDPTMVMTKEHAAAFKKVHPHLTRRSWVI
jgi:hypothetical protein